MTQLSPTALEEAAKALYREFENRPLYAQTQMNGVIANECATAAVAAASKRGASSFFPAPDDRRGDLQGRNIHERVEWSKTSRGGRQFDMLDAIPPPRCSSFYQLCE